MYIDDEGMYLPMCYADSQINELSSVKTPIWYIIRTWFVYYLSIMEFIRNRSSIKRYRKLDVENAASCGELATIK